jgi:hypothetical protein
MLWIPPSLNAPGHTHRSYVAYPAIFARPGYGSLAPLTLSVTLLGVVSTGGWGRELDG